MGLQSISQVSKLFNISTRTLRYYEQIGLIQAVKKENFAYRTYDENTVTRLQQIIILRKLRIPLKQIAEILKSEDTATAINAFQQNLVEIDDEIIALSTIKNIIQILLERLRLQNDMLRWLDDENLLKIVDSLTASKINFKEDKTMGDLNKASDKLNKLADKDVRIVYLPPATVASIHRTGGTPENETGDLLFAFIKEKNLPVVKPDFRHYGFNHPNGSLPDGSDHGFERWVTIPDDMEVSAPFVKKQFAGGLYGAHMIQMGAFEEWDWLYEWANNHEKYEMAWGDPDCMHGLMEEHLDAIHHYLWSHEECDQRLQLDLLIPIRERVCVDELC